MNYIGIKKPEDRAAMIAWLRTLHDAPLPLPTAAEIAAEAAELAPPEPEEAVEVLEDAVEAIAN
jgi:cytochrome c